MAVIGAKEMEANCLNLRIRTPNPEDSGAITSEELGSLPVGQVLAAFLKATQTYTDLSAAFAEA
jgi:hypothetical protein